MSCASWSKLGGGKLRRDCPELELARELWDWGRATGFRPQEKGRVVELRLHTEARLRGGATACGAVVGGPDVLHGRVLAALLGQRACSPHPTRAARRCAACKPKGQPAVAAAPT